MATFSGATFQQVSGFFGTAFKDRALFIGVVFTQKAGFLGSTFAQDADFSRTTFTQDTDFRTATFVQAARFTGATFTQGADFSATTFRQMALFFWATFAQDAKFSGATFGHNADFPMAIFKQIADFRGSRFMGIADFRETQFRRDAECSPGPIFSFAEFSRPEAVLFYKTYLGHALFHNCNVSKLAFSSVEWPRRKPNGKRMVFEEVVNLQSEDLVADALRPSQTGSDERDYSLIAELYQQLKKNYDDKRDYWAAGDFHYGEMEMKRLSSPRKNPVLRWLHRHLGLVAWYKYASQYGEGYARPALWLFGVLLFFACLYPLVGLQYHPTHDRPQARSPFVAQTRQPANLPSNTAAAQSPDPVVLTYALPFRPGEDTHSSWWPARLRLFWHSLWTSVFLALFQKELVYEPVYLWGRVLAVFEQTLTSTLFALFILAVRRQFRR